jgi:hypothetical protein
MKKQTYRITRRHGSHAAGDEVQLTEAEAIAIENEAPGVLEGPITDEKPKAAEPAKPAKDAT